MSVRDQHKTFFVSADHTFILVAHRAAFSPTWVAAAVAGSAVAGPSLESHARNIQVSEWNGAHMQALPICMQYACDRLCVIWSG
jgi:hypothetical protein